MTVPVPLGIVWCKSSYSGAAACIEVARGPVGVLVRDSNNPAGLTLSVAAADWRAFLIIVKAIAR
jgi:hypothetical protein